LNTPANTYHNEWPALRGAVKRAVADGRQTPQHLSAGEEDSDMLAARGNMEIADWRKKIDGLDEQIVRLISERAAAAAEIGKLKAQNSAPIYEPQREQAVFQHVCDVNPGPLSSAQIRDVYERLMDVMRALQRPKS
jgi:chorismate mutase